MTDPVREKEHSSGSAGSSEAFSAWCKGVEASLEELSAQMRGLLQAQTQLNPKAPEKNDGAVVVARRGKGKAGPPSAEDEEKAAKKRELRRKMMQCELEDLREENAKIRKKIRRMMESQRDTTLTCIMVTAFVALFGSILVHFIASRRPDTLIHS